MERTINQLRDPLEILSGEHKEAMKHLDKIRDAANSIQVNGFSAKAFQEMAESINYIATEMHSHSDKEERFLFPLLDKYVFEHQPALRFELREMWQTFHELVASVRDVEEGRLHSTTVREMIHLALRVVDNFQRQIEKENTTIFPMIKRLLSEQEYKNLTHEIASLKSTN